MMFQPGQTVTYRFLLFMTACMVFPALFLSLGCSGQGGGAGAFRTPTSAKTGFFVDSPVEGLQYRTLSWSGFTEPLGVYYFQPGEDVTFHLGETIIGRTQGQNILTPVEMSEEIAAETSSTDVVNIARTLQTLDDDQDPTNGIRIPRSVCEEVLVDISLDFSDPEFENSIEVEEMLDRLNGSGIYPEEVSGLVSAEEAQLHLEETINRIEEEQLAAEEALENLKLQAMMTDPYSSIIMVQGQSLDLSASVIGGKTPYTYSWRIDGNDTYSTKLNPGRYTFNTMGTHTIVFTAKDAADDTSTDIQHVMVYGAETQDGPFETDTIPTVIITSPSASFQHFRAGETVIFEALINSGEVPLHYGWLVGSGSNTYDPTAESLIYTGPRTYRLSQPITLNAKGQYPVSLIIKDTPVGGKGADTHASNIMVVVE